MTALWTRLLKQYPSRLTIVSHTPATSISTSTSPPGPFVVHTPGGTYPARHVIHATNAHVSHLIPSLRDHVVPVRAHMTAQRPGPLFPALPSGRRSWSVIYPHAFDYATQRPGSDGNPGDLLVGGGWTRSPSRGADAIGVFSDDTVEPFTVRYLAEIFPALFEPSWGPGAGIDLAWSGIIAVTPDALPFVGRLDAATTGRSPGPRSVAMGEKAVGPAEWIAAGYNGEGMVFAFLSGAALAAHVAGRDAEELDPRPGIPGGRVADWFPPELYVCGERLAGDAVMRDTEGLFSCPPAGPR